MNTFDGSGRLAIVIAGVLVGLIVLGSVAPTGAIATGTDLTGATDSTRTIDLTKELHLTPESPGEIGVTLRFRIPENVVELKTRVPQRATVTATNGFVEREGSEYAWDERTPTPSLTYRLPVNETLDAEGPIAGRGDLVFVDAGPWALVRIPRLSVGWSWTGGGTVSLSRSTTTAGAGAVGDAVAFLGEHRQVTRTANGQQFRLIIPTQANLTESPSHILDSLAAASGTLQVGDRDDRVFAVAAPTRSIRWAVRGLQTGDSDMWVRDIERLDAAGNTWIHEYVHTRQDYAASSDARWFTEGSATYYAALLTLDQGRIGFDAFRNRLALGTRPQDRNAVLADPKTWDTVAPYTKGALVAGELDRQIRLATDRTRSLQDAFGRMNGHGELVTGSAFLEMVRTTAGPDTAALADRYTTTGDTPQMWDQAAHDRAFGATPARITYSLPDPSDPAGFRVRGPFRQGSVDGERPIQLAVGETLAVDVRVTNTGGTAGTYDARLLVNGAARAQRTGRLEPGESATLTFAHEFSTAGEYTLAVGGETVGVSVGKPATPTVRSIEVTELASSRRTGRAVTLAVGVGNDRAIPAAGNLTLRHNGEPIETRRIELPPARERTITFTATGIGPGVHVFRVGTRTVAVTVESTHPSGPGQSPATATTRTPTSTTSRTASGGFGAPVTVLALVGVALGLARRVT